MPKFELVCGCAPKSRIKKSNSLRFNKARPYKMNHTKKSKSPRSAENHRPEDRISIGAGVPSETATDSEFLDLPQPLPPGFLNLGNTCYINTTLQCLFTVHPLLQWLLKPNNFSTLDRRLTNSLSKLVVATFRRKFKTELQEFRDLVGILHSDFKEAREQDAQEFLIFLLDRLHEENILRSTESEVRRVSAGKRGTSRVCHEENMLHPAESEVHRIFAGKLRTSIVCPDCYEKEQPQLSTGKWFHSKSLTTPQGEPGEVFLSLSLPIPLKKEQIDGATLGADPRHLRHRVVLNEIIQQPTPSWRQRRLSFDSKATIESVYKQADTLVDSAPSPVSGARLSSHDHVATASSGETAEPANITSASVLASSTSLKTPVLLVQATASGFGAWFLDETGLGANLVDGLDVEAICGPLEPSNLLIRQQNFLYGDSVFLVHLKGSPAIMTDCPNGGCDRMDVDSADEDDGMLRILLIHVTESGQKENEEEHDVTDSYRAVGENAGPAPKFRRFSPPLLILVRPDIQFDELRKNAIRALTDFLGCRPLNDDNDFEDDQLLRAFFGLRFWIVDAGPGEVCEIRDESNSYPLLHDTVDLSSVPVPFWMLPSSNGDSANRPKLLRLLAVWPTSKLPPIIFRPPTPCSPTNDITSNISPIKGERHHHTNGEPSHSLHPSKSERSHPSPDFTVPVDPPSTASAASSSASAEFSLSDCFKAFTECERLPDDKEKCPRCSKRTKKSRIITKLLNAPAYLLLHLNRFVRAPCTDAQDSAKDSVAWDMRKIYSLVDYPIDGLDISCLMEKSPKSSLFDRLKRPQNRPFLPPYDLVAVCNHKGQLDSGHYTAICRNLFTNQWWHYSDKKVVKVSADQVVQASAYILFYKKRGAYSDREQQELRRILAKLAIGSLGTSLSVSPLSKEGTTTMTEHHISPRSVIRNSGPDSDESGDKTSHRRVSFGPIDKRSRPQKSPAARNSSTNQSPLLSEGKSDHPAVGENVYPKHPPPVGPKPRSRHDPMDSSHGKNDKPSDPTLSETSIWKPRDNEPQKQTERSSQSSQETAVFNKQKKTWF